MTFTSVVVAAIVAMLGIAAVLAVVRIVRGPGVVDRAVATDVLVATVVVALGVESGVRRDHLTVPILVSLALLGFVGSVAVARFVVPGAGPAPTAADARPRPMSDGGPDEASNTRTVRTLSVPDGDAVAGDEKGWTSPTSDEARVPGGTREDGRRA